LDKNLSRVSQNIKRGGEFRESTITLSGDEGAIHTLQCAHPSHGLRGYIRAYAQRQMYVTGGVVVEPAPAWLESIMTFQFGQPYTILFNNGQRSLSPDASVIGLQTHQRAQVLLNGTIETFGIFFQPAGFWQLFGVPICKLTDQEYEADCLLGRQVRSLRDELGETSCFENRVRIIERFLVARAARVSVQDSMAAAINHVLRLGGTAHMTDIACQSGLSLRQFERRFLRQMGVAPKSFARIARFQRALETKIAFPLRTWLEIAHELGYHDQMHMIHDFRSLSGNSPSRILAQIGDMRPTALIGTEAE
jgi:AraC-like DNA-binding protein